MDDDDLALIIEAFPLVFGLDAADQMAPVLSFWLDELALRREDVPRICRAFPSLLGVDVATLTKSLTHRTISTGLGERITSPLAAEECAATRDALCGRPRARRACAPP